MLEQLLNPIVILLIIVLIPVLVFFLMGLVIIRDDQVGIRIRKIFGKPMPQGQIIARQHGDVGIQADILMPKLYWFNPVSWKITKSKITEVKPGQIGVVEAIDGQPLPKGRLLGDHVECNAFQDAKMFLDNGGRRGPQVEILRPGFYRVNTELFRITVVDATKINERKIGVVVAQDGNPLPSGFIISPKPITESHKFFQDGQEFITQKGYRGPQLDTLQPGEYYVNPLLFEVQEFDITEVRPGYVAVLRSNIGQELVRDKTTPKPTTKKADFEQPVHELEEVILTTDQNERGIWIKPVAPGNYNLNPLALDAYMVPTSAVTIDWAAGSEIRAEHRIGGQVVEDKIKGKAEEFFKFSQLRVTSKDGFQLDVDVRMIIRIRPQHASFIIARFGTVANLIEQIVHPLIDASFRNKAGEKKAIDFVMSRTDLQKEALERAKEEFEKYHVEAQNLLIAYIAVDENLLRTQTDKEIAIQQQTQYEQQALAQAKRITVKEQEARAEMQPKVIEAKLSIDISNDKAEALRREAGGIRDKTKYIADGDAYQNRQVGIAIAQAYQAQSDVIGPKILGTLKAFQEIGTGQIKITPDVLVTGGTDGSGGNLINALLAMLIKEGALNLPKQVRPIKSKPYEEIKESLNQVLPSLPIEKVVKPSTETEYVGIAIEPESSKERIDQLDEEVEKDADERTKSTRTPTTRTIQKRTRRNN